MLVISRDLDGYIGVGYNVLRVCESIVSCDLPGLFVYVSVH